MGTEDEAYGNRACEKVFKLREWPPPSGYFKNVKKCKTWIKTLEFLKEFYYRKLIPRRPEPLGPGPIPGIDRLIGDPSPQPSGFLQDTGIQELLLGELFVDALKRDPTPTPMDIHPISLFSQIRKSGAHLDVIKELIHEFESATEYLKKELEVLGKQSKK